MLVCIKIKIKKYKNFFKQSYLLHLVTNYKKKLFGCIFIFFTLVKHFVYVHKKLKELFFFLN